MRLIGLVFVLFISVILFYFQGMNWMSSMEQQQQQQQRSSRTDNSSLAVPSLPIPVESPLPLAPTTPNDQNVPATPNNVDDATDINAALATPKNSDNKFFSSPSVSGANVHDNINKNRIQKHLGDSRTGSCDSGVGHIISLCSNSSRTNSINRRGGDTACTLAGSSESQSSFLSDQNVPVTPKNNEDDIMKSFSISPLMSLRELQLRSGGSTPGLPKQYMRKGGSSGYRCSPYMYHRGSAASPMTHFMNRSESPLSRSASGRSLSSSFSSSASLSYGKAANRSLVYDRPYSWPSKGSSAVYHQQQQQQHKKQLFPTSASKRHHRGMSASPSPIAFSRTSKDLMAPRSRVSPVSALSKSPFASSSGALYGGRAKSSMAWRSSTDAFRFDKERSVFKSHDNMGSSYNDFLPSPLK